jgi:hypothetical protein
MLADLEPLAAAGCLFVRLARGEKRPVGAAWQTRGTGDLAEVARWLRSGSNVGLLLGPESGVIDVEYDEPAGRDELARLGLLDAHTPTWRSARGEHRLFRWHPDLPATAVRRAGALELRLGGRAAQSVLPPSRHPTGAPYAWTVRPADAPVAELPAAVIEELLQCVA